MKLMIKRFNELTVEELYEIYKLRVSVFVVEQNCPYQEIDEADKHAWHIWLEDEEGIQAYLRVVEAGINFPEVSIGRVLSRKRRCGLGSRIVAEGIHVAENRLGAESIRIEAQVYARKLYEKAGFVQVSDEFLEDGILHIQMCREKQI
ncbi:MAG: GNAT family N-acetyltransferase [Clostridia bacterium]|jgi:ElaA protein|nr:GNAT family N-acetyltransferase [Lachnospiraceae bacterium]NCC01625.1 GNAT family N-acetyltransferase [Clostridia bacterium]NCD01671.1 GNAT family N-acetyltransferase [Clostridia bacterium]